MARTLIQHLAAGLIVLGGVEGGGDVSAAMPDARTRRPLGGGHTPCAPLTAEEKQAWTELRARLPGDR